MHGDKVARLHQGVKVGGEADAAVDHPRVLHGEEGVVADDLHAEREGGVGDHRADGAQPDDAQRLPEHFLPDKFSLALFDEF